MTPTLTMNRRITSNEIVSVTEPAQQEAEALVEKATGSVLGGFSIVVDGEDVPLGENLSKLMAHVIEAAATRGSITVRAMPEEVSTTVAAHELGISRPTLMKLIRSGELPAHSVGSHTRLRYADVREAAERINTQKSDAFVRLLHVSESLGEK